MDVAYARFTMIDQSGMSPFVQSSFAYAHHWGPLATVAELGLAQDCGSIHKIAMSQPHQIGMRRGCLHPPIRDASA